MKWDIDKALAALGAAKPDTNLQRVTLEGIAFMTSLLGPLTSEERETGTTLSWCLRLGKERGECLWFHGRTIREVYLKARKAVKKLTPEKRAFYGVKVPLKSNSYASARRKKARK